MIERCAMQKQQQRGVGRPQPTELHSTQVARWGVLEKH